MGLTIPLLGEGPFVWITLNTATKANSGCGGLGYILRGIFMPLGLTRLCKMGIPKRPLFGKQTCDCVMGPPGEVAYRTVHLYFTTHLSSSTCSGPPGASLACILTFLISYAVIETTAWHNLLSYWVSTNYWSYHSHASPHSLKTWRGKPCPSIQITLPSVIHFNGTLSWQTQVAALAIVSTRSAITVQHARKPDEFQKHGK